jgi:putative peptide zinc metalloprotease protein
METERAHPSTRSVLTPTTPGRAQPDVWAALSRSIATEANGAPGVWAALTRLIATDANGDLWRDLDDRIDLGSVVPKPAANVVVRRLTGRDGRCHYVLRSPSWHYLRLDAEDFALWQRIDGRSTVREIAVAQFVERGEFVAERLARLVMALRAGGFLVPPLVNCFDAVRDRLGRSFWRRFGRRGVRVFTRPLAQLHDADRLFGTAYRSAGWLLFTRPAQLLWILVVVVGLAIWWYQFEIAAHPLLQARGSYALGVVVLIILDSLGVSLYSFAQGLAIKRHGREIAGAGVMLAGIVPAAYVETSDIWLAERRARLAISWTGPYAMLILSAMLAILSLPHEGTELGATLFKGATIWLANTAFNLLPVIDSAGYLMLVDYLELPGLRARAADFIRHGLAGRLSAPWRIGGDERIYAMFGLATALTYVLIPLVILEARDLRYADAIQELWAQPRGGGRVLAVIVALLFLGPAAISLLHRLTGVLLWATAPVQRRWRAWRGRVPTEHVTLLASLPCLHTAPRAELSRIAAYLEPRSAPAGSTLIRQGDRADRLYLLRAGVVRVSRTRADGRVETLATLGPGDYFGETALLAGVRRTANVIAETDVRLLTLRGGRVRRWIAGRPGVVEALRRSLVGRDWLMAVPVLHRLGAPEIDRLAMRLLITRYLPGDTIVRQGERGDRFYILVDGHVDVSREDAGGSRHLATLGPGQVFGEMALLDQTPRSATVRALTAVETYTLSETDFGELLRHRPVSESLRWIAAQRVSATGAGLRRPASPTA